MNELILDHIFESLLFHSLITIKPYLHIQKREYPKRNHWVEGVVVPSSSMIFLNQRLSLMLIELLHRIYSYEIDQ